MKDPAAKIPSPRKQNAGGPAREPPAAKVGSLLDHGVAGFLPAGNIAGGQVSYIGPAALAVCGSTGAALAIRSAFRSAFSRVARTRGRAVPVGGFRAVPAAGPPAWNGGPEAGEGPAAAGVVRASLPAEAAGQAIPGAARTHEGGGIWGALQGFLGKPFSR